MTYPRNKIINLQKTQYYHCVSRCVRRSFLCGKDHFTGRNYEHRRAWVENRLLLLAEVFTIDVYAYAVMHNHTHLVLYVDQTENVTATDLDVLKRWKRVRKLDAACIKYLDPTSRLELTESELSYVANRVKIIRERLGNISWFMSLLNQYIARKANKEDDCTGRFWEGRFKSQALLSEKAVIACMSYVDLNPVRAGIAKELKESIYTSIYRRLKTADVMEKVKLVPLNSKNHRIDRCFLNGFSLANYVSLLHVIAKRTDSSKEQVIKIGSLRISKNWMTHSAEFEKSFRYAAGTPKAIDRYRKLVRASITHPKYLN